MTSDCAAVDRPRKARQASARRCRTSLTTCGHRDDLDATEVQMGKFYLSAVVGALAVGCSSPDATGESSAPAPAQTADQAGVVKQRSQFADSTVFNIVDMGSSAWINLLADGDAVTVQVFYLGDKTTDSGHTPATLVLVDTLSLDSD